jgi:hypothetical protein
LFGKNLHGVSLATATLIFSGVLPAVRHYQRCNLLGASCRFTITREIGKYVELARRSGSSWFVGVVNGNEARSLHFPLAFLPTGKRYQVDLYTDDPAVTTRTHIAVTTQIVTSATVLTLPLKAAGGQRCT